MRRRGRAQRRDRRIKGKEAALARVSTATTIAIAIASRNMGWPRWLWQLYNVTNIQWLPVLSTANLLLLIFYIRIVLFQVQVYRRPQQRRGPDACMMRGLEVVARGTRANMLDRRVGLRLSACRDEQLPDLVVQLHVVRHPL